MRWRKFIKIILDHPFFEYRPNKILSWSEASRIFNSGFPTIEETIVAAKARYQLPSEAWLDFEAAIIKHRAMKQHPISIIKRALLSLKSYISNHKRVAVFTAVLILILSFFTLAPTGRALAKEFFNMIIQVIEDRIEITNENPTYEDSVYDDNIDEKYIPKDDNDDHYNEVDGMISYPDIKHFVEETGLIPITLKADWLTCQTINYLDTKDIDRTLNVQYSTSDGLAVSVTQIWYTDDDYSARIADVEYEKSIILGDKELYHAIDPVDGTFNGVSLLDNSVIMIGAESGVDVDKLLKLLK